MAYRIRNWTKFQHYKNRCPPWIRLHRRLLHDKHFHDLSGDDVKTLVMLWMLAADGNADDGALPEVQQIAFSLRTTVELITEALTRLSEFVECDASNMLATCYQDASKTVPQIDREIETERKKETPPISPTGGDEGVCEKFERGFAPERQTAKKQILEMRRNIHERKNLPLSLDANSRDGVEFLIDAVLAGDAVSAIGDAYLNFIFMRSSNSKLQAYGFRGFAKNWTSYAPKKSVAQTTETAKRPDEQIVASPEDFKKAIASVLKR